MQEVDVVVNTGLFVAIVITAAGMFFVGAVFGHFLRGYQDHAAYCKGLVRVEVIYTPPSGPAVAKTVVIHKSDYFRQILDAFEITMKEPGSLKFQWGPDLMNVNWGGAAVSTETDGTTITQPGINVEAVPVEADDNKKEFDTSE